MFRLRLFCKSTLFRTYVTEISKECVIGITIPSAIKRGPTDLLQALSDTVGVDTTAPHYGLIDDPLTIPTKDSTRKEYYMAKEMGRLSARKLAKEWPTLFAFDRDVPRLSAFRPQNPADPLKMDPTEANLLSIIENREVADAVILYERMRAENIEVNQKVQMELFKLVSFYNGSKVPFSEYEEWHGLRNMGKQIEMRWEQAGVADLLFESLPKTTETVSILIAGLCKYPSTESIQRARELYQSLSEAPLREAFDGLLSVVNWKTAQKLMINMRNNNIRPTFETWNGLLISASQITNNDARIEAYQKIMGEMQSVREPPNLRGFYIILHQLLEDKQKRNLRLMVSWLDEIISYLEHQTCLTCQSIEDHLFFLVSMRIAEKASNLELAERVLKLYENPRNEIKMPAFTVESEFYHRYLILFVDENNIDEIELKYKALVPRLTGVTKELISAISTVLEITPKWSLLFRLIEDGICSQLITDIKMGQLFRDKLLKIPFESLQVSEREEYCDLIRRMVDIWMEFSCFTNENKKFMQLKWNPSMISECALLLTRIGDSDRAYSLLNMLLDPKYSRGDTATVYISGHVRNNVMDELFEYAIREQNTVRAATCLEIISNFTTRKHLEPLILQMQERCNLNEAQRKILHSFIKLRPQ